MAFWRRALTDWLWWRYLLGDLLHHRGWSRRCVIDRHRALYRWLDRV